MYQSTLRRHYCCQSSLPGYLCNSHVRRLSTAGTVPVANGDRQAVNNLEPWQDRGSKVLANLEQGSKDIIVDDLTATLEAHRASNRAAVIRKIDNHGTPSPFKYPLLGANKDAPIKVEKSPTIKKHKAKSTQMWPRDSVQAKQLYGKTGSLDSVQRGYPFEYVGSVQWLQQPWKISNDYKDIYRQRPWLAYMENKGKDALERLTNEIKAFETYMRLSPQEEAASELVISDVNSVARKESQFKALTLLGSRSTGLASPISDFDFSLKVQVPPPEGQKTLRSENGGPLSQFNERGIKLHAVKALRKISKLFMVSNKFSDLELVSYARVPILRSKHVATGLDVQIQAMASYQASYEHTLVYLSEFPSLRPLYIVLRYFLELRGLTTVFEGGLGSYSILIMIVTALKHSSGKFTSDDLAGQLLLVLGFYGKADLYKVGFSADPPCVFEKRVQGGSSKQMRARMTGPQINGIGRMITQTLNQRKPYLLCLQDPANDLNDLGKNAYAIKHIQATFEFAKETLQSVLKEKKETSDDGTSVETLSYLDHLLRADYRTFESHRSEVGQWANLRTLADQISSKKETSKGSRDRGEIIQSRKASPNLGTPDDQTYSEGEDSTGTRDKGESKQSRKASKASVRPAWYRKVRIIRTVSTEEKVRMDPGTLDDQTYLNGEDIRRTRDKGESKQSPKASEANLRSTGYRKIRIDGTAPIEEKMRMQKLQGINENDYG